MELTSPQTVGLTVCSSLLSECCTKLRLLLDLIILQKQSRGREIGAPCSSHPHAALLLCGSAYGAPPSPVLVLLIGASWRPITNQSSSRPSPRKKTLRISLSWELYFFKKPCSEKKIISNELVFKLQTCIINCPVTIFKFSFHWATSSATFINDYGMRWSGQAGLHRLRDRQGSRDNQPSLVLFP